MNDDRWTWRGVWCSGLSCAIFFLFSAFVAYSVKEGISKQSVYTGPVGFWLGAYLLFALLASAICGGLVLWMVFRKESQWKWHASVLVSAWAATSVAYWMWHLFAQTQYVLAAT